MRQIKLREYDELPKVRSYELQMQDACDEEYYNTCQDDEDICEHECGCQ